MTSDQLAQQKLDDGNHLEGIHVEYWFIIHSKNAYNEKNDLIGFSASRKDSEKPHSSYVNQMKPKDNVVYYMKRPDSAILGIFKILEGTDFFYDGWKDSPFQFRIKELLISGEDPIPIQELVPQLDLFAGIRQSWPNKLQAAIHPLCARDYDIIERELKLRIETSDSDEISEDSTQEISKHERMIQASNDLAYKWNAFSYVGKQEQKAIFREKAETELSTLPEWLNTIAQEVGQRQKVQQIDNIWFIPEDGGFLVPLVAFEHERSKNDRAVLDRFGGLQSALKANRRFYNISPAFIVVVPDESHLSYFSSKLEKDGSWQKFCKDNQVEVLTVEDLAMNLISIIDGAKERIIRSYYERN